MRRLLAFAAVLFVAATACTGGTSTTGTSDSQPAADESNTSIAPSTTSTPPAEANPAPEFPDGLDWLNTATPLRMEDLVGKAVLLDFWTYGCINCIHIIPDLERLEAEYAEELVVIGVHSAKFDTEGATENIREIVLRYGIEHPVVNDPAFEVWGAWGARAWPTVVLVDPAGNVVGGHEGEGVYDVVAPVLAGVIAEFDMQGAIDRSPLQLSLESDGRPRTLLSYPGKVLAAPSLGSVFVADTGNHRIVKMATGTGEVTAVYGAGSEGYRDGAALSSRFNSPQGLALSPDGTTLYVADTGNHTIRAIELATGEVTTALGTGSKATGYPPRPGTAPGVALSSPWGLTEHNGLLYIAMAGSHQVWSYDPASGVAAPIVGTGGESTRNGPGNLAELAQPSGLVVGSDSRLYFADSESSSIRFTNLTTPDFITATLAGSDQTLFDFGDQDGTGTEARLQHPLGIAWDPASDTLLVADTYNSKIKQIDPGSGVVTTLFGGEQGWADGTSPLFFEPGGLSLDGDTLYVADTNNHAIRVVDLDTGVTSTIVPRGIEQFTPPPDDADYGGVLIELPPVAAGSGPGTFVLDIALPTDHKVNEDAPSSVTWNVDGEAVTLDPDADRSLTGVRFPVEVGASFAEGTATVTADLTVVYCREGAESLCFIEQLRFRVPVTVGPAASSPSIRLPYRIELPDL